MSLTGRPAEEPLRIRSLPWSVDIDGTRREEQDAAKIMDYAAAPDDRLVSRLGARQPAWSVNGLALAALPDLLAAADLPAWCAAVAGLRRDLVDLLAGHGLVARAADANWVLVESARLRTRLLGARGGASHSADHRHNQG